MASKFFRRVARHFANEVGVVTPNGKLLSGYPEEGLKKWRALPEAERRRLEDLGTYNAALDPQPPPGGLVLDVYARALTRTPEGRWQIYRTEVARSLEAGRDHLWLTGAEWKSLLPARPAKGERVEVPDPVVDRICRRYLIDLVRVGGNGGPRRREDVLAEHMRLTVVEVTPQTVRLKLAGSARLATQDVGSGARPNMLKIDTFQLLGRLEYDPRAKAIKRFEILALSETGHFDEIHHKVLPLGVTFELSRGEKPAERVAPSSFTKDYFASGRRS